MVQTDWRNVLQRNRQRLHQPKTAKAESSKPEKAKAGPAEKRRRSREHESQGEAKGEDKR